MDSFGQSQDALDPRQLIERAPQKVVALCFHQITKSKTKTIHEDSLVQAFIAAELQRNKAKSQNDSSLETQDNRNTRIKYLKRTLEYVYPKKEVPRCNGLEDFLNSKSIDANADENVNHDQQQHDHESTLNDQAKASISAAKNTLKSSLSGYIPHGILKKEWLYKHREILPAVVALICDFDVDCKLTEWNKHEKQILETIKVLKQNLDHENRSTVQIVLILIQKRDYPREMEVPKKTELAQDRITSLLRNSDVDSKNIMLLYTADYSVIDDKGAGNINKTMSASMVRIQERVDELSEEHYRVEGKRLRGYLRYLDRHSIGGLAMSIRLNFKIGQYYEARESTKALKHYEDAYDGLVEIAQKKYEQDRIGGHSEVQLNSSFVPYTANEIKNVAEFVHYRLITLHVASNHVHSVLGQFKKHAQAMGQLLGPREYIFQHYDWLSRQYFVFTDFITDIRPALALAHLTPLDRLLCNPFYYIHRAANYAVLRRHASQSLGVYYYQHKRVEKVSDVAMSKGFTVGPSMFVGAPPVLEATDSRDEHVHDNDGPSVLSETNELIMKSVYEKESSKNQSAFALTLLGSASSMLMQIKSAAKLGKEAESHMNRRLSEIYSKAGQEKIIMGDLVSAFEDLVFAVDIYHKERWWKLLASILPVVISCGEMLQKMSRSPKAKHENVSIFDQLETRERLIKFVLILLSPPMSGLVDQGSKSLAEANLKDWVSAPLSTTEGNGGGMSVNVDNLSKPGLICWNAEFVPPTNDRNFTTVGELATLHLNLKTTLSPIVEFNELTLNFEDSRYDIIIENNMKIKDAEAERSVTIKRWNGHGDHYPIKVLGNISFDSPNKYIRIKIVLPIQSISQRKGAESKQAEFTRLHLSRIGLTFAGETSYPVTLWSYKPYERKLHHRMFYKTSSIKDIVDISMENYSDVLLIHKIEPAAVVALDNHKRTALLGEIYPVNIVIDPQGDQIDNGRLRLKFNPVPADWRVTFHSQVGEEWKPIANPENVDILEVCSNTEKKTLSFSIGVLFESEHVDSVNDIKYSLTNGKVRVVLLYDVSSSSYEGNEYENHQVAKVESSLQISCAKPFTVDFKTIRKRSLFLPGDQVSRQSEESTQNALSQVVLEEPFVLSMRLFCGIPPGHEVVLHEFEYEPNKNVTVKPASIMTQTSLKHGEQLTNALSVTVKKQVEESQLGDIFVTWRSLDKPLDLLKSRIKLPCVKVLDPVFTFSLATTPHGWVNVGTTIDITLTIKNNTEAMQKISVQILQQAELENLQQTPKTGSGSEKKTQIQEQRDDQFYVTGSKKQFLALGPRHQQEAIFKCVALEPGNNSKSLALLVHSPRYNSMQTLPLRIAVR